MKIYDSASAFSSQIAWILKNLAILACILWLIDGASVSQLALNLYIKERKCNTGASKWVLWPAAIWRALWNYLLMSVSEAVGVLLQLAASASPVWCAELNWWPRLCRMAVACSRIDHPWALPLSSRLAGCWHQSRSSPSCQLGRSSCACHGCSLGHSSGGSVVPAESVWLPVAPVLISSCKEIIHQGLPCFTGNSESLLGA